MHTANLAKSLIPWATEPTQHSMTQPADDLIRRLQAGEGRLVAWLGLMQKGIQLRFTRDPDWKMGMCGS